MHTFHRNQNPADRQRLMNRMADQVDDHEERLGAIEQGGVSPTAPAADPGDLTVYYENGKA